MKKLLLALLLVLALALTLVACGNDDKPTENQTQAPTGDKTENPTDGTTEKPDDTHTCVGVEWKETKAPTCTEKGEKIFVCSCGKTVETAKIPATGHTEVTDKAVAATCTETGLTEGKHCSACNTVIEAQQTVPANGHTEVVDSAVAPTCTETGLTEGKHCSVCDTVIKAQEEVPANGHTEVVDSAVAPTCTETGLTEGKHCSVCGVVTVAQEEVPENGHNYQNRICIVCGAHKPSEGLKFTSNGDGTCSVSGIGDCTDTDIVIPYTSPAGDSVTYIGIGAFRRCSSLTSIVIPDSVTGIGSYAFSGCSSLTSIVIPSSVTSIGSYAFRDCSSLTSVVIPDSVTSIGSYAFSVCYKLVEVINKSSLEIEAGSKNYGYIAYYAKEVHNGESKIVNQNDYLFYTYEGTNYLLGYVGTDTELVLPENYNGQNYEIYQFAFRECSSLMSVVIPDSVKSISDYAFLKCSSLTSIVIPDSVTSIGGRAFAGCSRLTSVVIGNSVTSIGSEAFYGCSRLTSVVIGNSVTSIGNRAFVNCISLTSIEYKGTKSEWNSISKGGNWNYATGSYTIHCTDGDIEKESD